MKPQEDSSDNSRRPRSSIPARIVRWLLVTAGAVLLVAALAVGAVVWTLTPERLTPIAERYGSQYLLADVTARRVELTWWSTFPRLVLQVDSLGLKSRTLASLTPSQLDSLPPYADRLLSVSKLRGSVDLPQLLRGVIRLYDVEIGHPEINLVAYDDSVANYLIVPKSEEDKAADLPDLGIDRFTVTGGAPVRYFSLADSIDISVDLNDVMLDGVAEPRYTVAVSGAGAGRMPSFELLRRIPFGLDGVVDWSPRDPGRVALRDFDVTVGSITARIDATVSFGDSVRFGDLSLHLESVPFGSLKAVVDSVLGPGKVPDMTTDLKMSLTARAAAPFTVDPDHLPDMTVEIDIPEGRLEMDRMRLTRFAARMQAELPHSDPDLMRVSVDRLVAAGDGMGFGIDGKVTATGDLTDPIVEGFFKGGINLSRLPAQLASRIPCIMRGRLTGEASFRFRPSHIAKGDLTRLRCDGDLRLDGFEMAMRDSSSYAAAGETRLRFSANKVLTGRGRRVDSITTVSLSIDTLRASGGGMQFAGSRLSAGIGVRGLSGNIDTTRVLPLGIRLRGERAWLLSDSDSTTIRLRQFDSRAVLRRFEGAVNRARLDIDVSADRLRYADPLNRANLREAAVTLTLHPRKQPRLSRTALAIYDSISHVRPGLSLDSVYALTLAEQRLRRARRKASGEISSVTTRTPVDSATLLDFGVDNSLKRRLRLWEASGTVKATRARAFTPYYPVVNRLDSVNIAFNTDSIVITDTRYRSGRTSVRVNGTISNIASAITSRRGAPIDLKINLDFDTLDINSFAAAAFAGSSFAQRQDTLHTVIPDTESDTELQASVEKAAGSDTLAFIVPSNVRADLSLRARQVLYADIWFQRVTGRVEVGNSAIHLDRLGGYTDIGTLDLTALYSAPALSDIDFAAGLVIRRLDLRKFLHMMPQVDSLLPLLEHIGGIITADVAMSTQLDSLMDIKFHTLQAAMKLEGDSLVVLDNRTFQRLSKWLVFKNKERNMIDHMAVELFVRDSRIEFLPFQFDIDRYRLGVWGGNTLDMHYDYHIAVLRSPLPFKFGIGITGHGDDFRIRLGKANFNPDQIVSTRQLTDTTRINLVNEIRNMFSFGVRTGHANRRLEIGTLTPAQLKAEYAVGDTLTHADSVLFMREGVLEMTPAVADSLARAEAALEQWEQKHDRKKKNKSKKRQSATRPTEREAVVREENGETTE